MAIRVGAAFAIPIGADPLVHRPGDPERIFYSPAVDIGVPRLVVEPDGEVDLVVPLALPVSGSYFIYGAAIEILRQRMEPITAAGFLRHDDYIFPFGLLQRAIEQFEAAGAKTLEPPWPSADLDPPVDGRFYSSERLLERAARV